MSWCRLSQAASIMAACLLSIGCQIFDLAPAKTPMAFNASQADSVQNPNEAVQRVNAPAEERPIMQASYMQGSDAPAQVLDQTLSLQPAQPPGEGKMYSLPMYRIESPDILIIMGVNLVPRDPYIIQPLDIIQLSAGGALPDRPIAGPYQVEPSGMVNLGPGYGAVMIAGLSVPDATTAIEQHLRGRLNVPDVTLTVTQIAGQQIISGEHLVAPDGTVNLGVHGSVYVVGMTVTEAARAIEMHLSRTHQAPSVSVDIFAYNSKVYYVVIEGAGLGDNVIRLPITGNETVLDAIAQMGGLTEISSTNIWIARPGPVGMECHQILPVDWEAITRGADTATNYQIFPGDRVVIAEDRMRTIDSFVAKISTPFERIAGSMLLWGQAIQTMQRFPGGLRNF